LVDVQARANGCAAPSASSLSISFQRLVNVIAPTEPNSGLSSEPWSWGQRSPGCSEDEVRVEAIREREHSLSLAAAQLRSALQLLDKVEAPPHIAAQLDLALYQLEQELDLEKARGDLVQIERNAELQ
jgi:hypothetical protein